MATKPMTKEAIALTEKKMDMTLDEIIKMSKNGGPRAKKFRLPNKSQRTFYNAAQQKSMRLKHYMNSRSSMRQGVLAQRRSNFQGSQFPFTNEAARMAAVLPFQSGPFGRDRRGNPNRGRNGAAFSNSRNASESSVTKREQLQQQQEPTVGTKQKPQTLDVLFANLKEQRLNSMPRRNSSLRRNSYEKQIPPWSRARLGK